MKYRRYGSVTPRGGVRFFHPSDRLILLPTLRSHSVLLNANRKTGNSERARRAIPPPCAREDVMKRGKPAVAFGSGGVASVASLRAENPKATIPAPRLKKKQIGSMTKQLQHRSQRSANPASSSFRLESLYPCRWR